jgi:hypothetical protein
LAAVVGGIGLAVSRPGQVPLWAPACELALLVVVIISTVALQGCQHRALAGGFDQRTISLLVCSNRIRVAAWSAAGAIALWMCHQVFSAQASMPRPGGGQPGSRSAAPGQPGGRHTRKGYGPDDRR